MTTFYLIDCAMVYDALRAATHFADPKADWIAALLPHPGLRLAGPMLMAPEKLKDRDPAINAEALRIANAFPRRMHLSFINTELTFNALADHLRRFAYFGDNTGQPYGLRIADCRVLDYLSGTMGIEQWDAMTAPIEEWIIHDRKGTKKSLGLNEARRKLVAPSVEMLRLNEEQIENLIDLGEGDALLEKVGRHPEMQGGANAQRDFETAWRCLKHWKASGSANRSVLLAFTRMVFESPPVVHADNANLQRIFRKATVAVQ